MSHKEKVISILCTLCIFLAVKDLWTMLAWFVAWFVWLKVLQLAERKNET